MNFLERFINYLGSNNKSKPINEPTEIEDVARQLLDAHNAERILRKLTKLRLNDKLTKTAIKHATWMNESNMSHVGLGGTSVADRVKVEGYRPKTIGENIACGYTSISSVMSGWMASTSGHRRNILCRTYIDAGFAKVGNHWCAILAGPGNTLSEEILISYGGPLNSPLCG